MTLSMDLHHQVFKVVSMKIKFLGHSVQVNHSKRERHVIYYLVKFYFKLAKIQIAFCATCPNFLSTNNNRPCITDTHNINNNRNRYVMINCDITLI